MVYGPLPIYPLYHPYYAQAPDFKPTDAFYNKLVSAITEDEALIGMNWYQEALIGRVQAMAAKDLEDRDNLTFTNNWITLNKTSKILQLLNIWSIKSLPLM